MSHQFQLTVQPLPHGLMITKLQCQNENFGKAFISIVKGTGDSSLMKTLPSFITAPFMNIAIKAEANKVLKEDEIPLKSLVTAMQYLTLKP